jgi:hypothetical protein
MPTPLRNQPSSHNLTYGKSLKPSSLPADFFPLAFSSSPSTLGLPALLLLPIMRAIRKNAEEMREALRTVEMRMVGASLLIVYEAEWGKDGVNLKQLNSEGTKIQNSNTSFEVLIPFWGYWMGGLRRCGVHIRRRGVNIYCNICWERRERLLTSCSFRHRRRGPRIRRSIRGIIVVAARNADTDMDVRGFDYSFLCPPVLFFL